jgi:peroxiredoxin
MQKQSYQKSLYSLKGLRVVWKSVPNLTSVRNLFRVLADSFRFEKEYTSVLKVKVGDPAPKFELPNAVQKIVSLERILKERSAVLIFYRGGWCPFCNLQLRVYQNYVHQFEQAGATLIAISPQIPDQSLSQQQKQALKFEVLSDVGNKVARKYTTLIHYSHGSRKALKGLGINFDEYYEEGATEVPIPAVVVIDQKGIIIFAQSEGGDYKKRVEPVEVLAALNRQSTDV